MLDHKSGNNACRMPDTESRLFAIQDFSLSVLLSFKFLCWFNFYFPQRRSLLCPVWVPLTTHIIISQFFKSKILKFQTRLLCLWLRCLLVQVQAKMKSLPYHTSFLQLEWGYYWLFLLAMFSYCHPTKMIEFSLLQKMQQKLKTKKIVQWFAQYFGLTIT
jgi:hypothetical protein